MPMVDRLAMVLFERPFPLCSCWNLVQGFAGAISFGDSDGALTPAEPEAVEVFREVDAAACSELLAAAHAPDTPPRPGKGEVEEVSPRSCEPDVIFIFKEVELYFQVIFTDAPPLVDSSKRFR